MPHRSSAPQERAEAIEILLLWEGSVSRSRLLELFQTHPTIISRDLAAFRRKWPEAMRYSTEGKEYIASLTLRPQLTRGEFNEYIGLLGGRGGRGSFPLGVPFDDARVSATRVSYPLFSRLHRAVREGICLTTMYRSMRKPEPHVRTLRPHAFVQAGPRWHVRGYCAETGVFADFNLARIVEVKSCPTRALPGGEDDAAWNTRVDLRLVPHRDLSPPQKMLVRDEYLRGTTALVLSVRAALVKYVVRAYRAALDPAQESAPAHLLMVKNPEALPDIARW